MKKKIVLLSLLSLLLLIWCSFITFADTYQINTVLNYSKPGSSLSDSRPKMLVGATWNLRLNFSTEINRIDKTMNWFKGKHFLGTQDAILIEIATNISPDEIHPVEEKNLTRLKKDGQFTAYDDGCWFYYYTFSPKQKNQQLDLQLKIQQADDHFLAIQYYFIKNADDYWFMHGIDIIDLINIVDDKNKQYYKVESLENSKSSYKFAFE